MPNILLHANFTPSNAQVWNSDPVFGNGTRHQISASIVDAGGNAVVPAHTYTSGTMVLKGHVATPYTPSWPYYFTFRLDGAAPSNPYSLLGTGHAWRQPINNTTSGPGTALEDDFVLPDVWLAYINAHAGGAMTLLVNLNATVQVPNSTTIVLDSLTLNLTYSDAPGTNFAKKWSAALVEGRGICTFVDTSGALQVSTTRSLEGGITAGKTTPWTTPYQLAPHSADCNCAIHPGKGRGQIWYTALDSSGSNPASVYTTSATAGAAQDWSSPTTITARTGYSLTTLTQPYSPRWTGSAYQYVTSQSSGTGLDAGASGKDARLCWYPSGLYNVTSGGATVVGNAFVCMDDAVGDKWNWTNLAGAGAFNSVDGAPPLPATDSSIHGTGRIYGSVVGDTIAKSAIVKADNDTLYQLIFAKGYNRFAKVVPRSSTIGANSFTNNVNNQPPTPGSLTNHYTLQVPAGTDSIGYVRFNWIETTRERALVNGTLDSPNKPTKIRFDIPALLDIPSYTPGSGAYGGVTYLSASVQLDLTYINAQGLQIAFSHDLTGGGAGDKYPVAQQAKTPVLNGRGEFTGAANWDFYGDIDIDRSRSSTIQFDVLISGTFDSLTVKSAKLQIHNLQCDVGGDTLTLSSAQSMTTATPLTVLYGGPAGEIEVNFAAVASGTAPAAPSLLTEIDGRHGLDWNFDVTWTQHNGLGAGGADKVLPFDTAFVDQYAQLGYAANQTDSTKGDFFLCRSRDFGKSWEFASDGKAISQLSGLRDWNNTNGADIKMPALVTEDNIVHCIWVESSLVRSIATQDAGETWSAP